MIEIKIIAETQEDNQVIYHEDFKYDFYTTQEIAIIVLELENLKCKLLSMSRSIKPIATIKKGEEKNNNEDEKL